VETVNSYDLGASQLSSWLRVHFLACGWPSSSCVFVGDGGEEGKGGGRERGGDGTRYLWSLPIRALISSWGPHFHDLI